MSARGSPGETVADLKHFLQDDIKEAMSIRDFLGPSQGMLLQLHMLRSQVLASHRVFTTGSAKDIFDSTQVLQVLDNLEARIPSHPSNNSSSSSAQQQAQPQPVPDVDDADNLSFNALAYVALIVGALLKAQCKNMHDKASLLREPMATVRSTLVPRLRRWLMVPNPQTVQEVLRTVAVLTGLYVLDLDDVEVLQELVVFERYPARHVVARWLDSTRIVSRAELRSLITGLQEAVAAKEPASPKPPQPTSVDFDFPASSKAELAVCDACGRHNYHPVLIRGWPLEWKEPCQLKVCSGCKQRTYCSAECQKVHWKGHKKRCRAMQAARQKGTGNQ